MTLYHLYHMPLSFETLACLLLHSAHITIGYYGKNVGGGWGGGGLLYAR